MQFSSLARLIAMLFVLALIERSFLFIFLNRWSENQESALGNYIASIKVPTGVLMEAGWPAHKCDQAVVAYVYEYNICSTYCVGDDGVGCILIRVQHPSGFLTLIPRDYPDRMLFDGRNILVLDYSKNVIKDLRQY